MTGRLIQLSGIVVDLNYRVRAVPKAGQEAIVHDMTLQAGGGFNAMVAARRMGMAVAYGGVVGHGPFAQIVAHGLAAQGISVLLPPDTGRDQGLCTVLIDDAGERTFISKEGAEGFVTPDRLSGLTIGDKDWLLLSGYALSYAGSGPALADWLLSLPRWARLVFDPSPLVAQIPEPILAAAMQRAGWISANAQEAEVLTGLQGPAAASALAAGRTGALVRDGRSGCIVALAGGRVQTVAGFQVATVDTNGAGDSHIGSFIAALDAGQTPVQAARFANAAAALSTTRHGSATAPDLAETTEFLAAKERAKQPAS